MLFLPSVAIPSAEAAFPVLANSILSSHSAALTNIRYPSLHVKMLICPENGKTTQSLRPLS
jgi:hypothetical protein